MIKINEHKFMFSQEQIQERVKCLGKEITNEYFGDRPLVMVCVLKGASVFFSDLLRSIDMPVHTEFITASSYKEGTKSTGNVKLVYDFEREIKDENILIVEDIIDSGLTIAKICDVMMNGWPSSITVCSLLRKDKERDLDLPHISYVGFDNISKTEFVVGYGMDYVGGYRNLPYIISLDQTEGRDII